MKNFRNIVVLVPQNKNQFVKLRLQFLEDKLTILAEADKGEEGEKDSLELIKSLYIQLKQDGIAHDVCTRNCGRMNIIDRIEIPFMSVSEIQTNAYDYIAMTGKGEEAKGVVRADEKANAIAKLRRGGLFPISVIERKRKV
ncbi:hypothetical protein HYT26_04940 [Candidatus Pacearchaeota archaeon]|nr:hypothetical protein [Candidatus Pacearchaeota archaeon]